MGIQTQFDKFHKKIKLGREDQAYKSARDRDESILLDVKAAFKAAGHPITSNFIQGSMSTATAIVPLSGDYDIDRALVIDEEYAPVNPVDPKQIALSVLENRGFKNAKIKMPCVTAHYSYGNVHIDYPIYKRQDHQYHIAIGKKNSVESNRSWESTDPRGLIDWINDNRNYGSLATDKQRQFQRLTRYIKRWRDHNFSETVASKIYSIGLTVMVKEQFRPSFNSEGFRDDLRALLDTVDAILYTYFTYTDEGKYQVSAYLPKSPRRDIFHGSSADTGTKFRNKLKRLRDKLEEASKLADVAKQAKIIQNLLGYDFEVPEPKSTNPDSVRKAVYPTSGAVGTSQGA